MDLILAVHEVLAGSMDYQATLEKIGELTCAHFSAWCVIDVLRESGEVERRVVAHRDPSKRPLCERIKRDYPPRRNRLRGVYHTLKTGEPSLIPVRTREMRVNRAESAEHLELIEALGSESYMCVPLKARDRVIGSLIIQSDVRTYGEEDLRSACELARHFAVAADNARMYSELEESARMRGEFISIAAHEIRTPLMPLLFQVRQLKKLLEKGTDPVKDDAGQRDARMSRLRELSGELNQLTERVCGAVHELMDASRLSMQSSDLNGSETSLGSVVRQVIQELSRASGAPLKSRVELDIASDCVGIWDAFKIERLVTNLLSNAVKYGLGEPIRVSVRESDGEAVLSIHDRGVGISPEDMERLFKPYYRIKTRIKAEGTGLGLYIADQIARLHGGSIAVTSSPERGTVFTVTLPLRASRPGLARGRPEARPLNLPSRSQ
jgi:signal transduction histidine kinase